MIEWILIVFVLIFAGFLCLVAPNKGRESCMEIYKGRVIAHRGLHELDGPQDGEEVLEHVRDQGGDGDGLPWTQNRVAQGEEPAGAH